MKKRTLLTCMYVFSNAYLLDMYIFLQFIIICPGIFYKHNNVCLFYTYFILQGYLQQIRLLVRDRSLSLGCLLFNITVMKLLLTVSEDVRECWTNQEEEDNIINCIFDIIPSCKFFHIKKLQYKLTQKIYENILS